MHDTRSLPDRYRPRRLANVLGQRAAVAELMAFVAAPHPTAFLLAGPTGTGKTASAHALAVELGVAVERAEFGGLLEIASGEQTAQTVREVLCALHRIPWHGSGWRVLIVNEADRMSEAVETIWLDALERLPARAVVAFTTNNPDRLSDRMRDRCREIQYTGDARQLGGAAQALVAGVWAAEGAQGEPPLHVVAAAVRAGQLSFRRVLQAVASALATAGTAAA